MGKRRDDIDVVSFDSYSTVVRVESAATALEQYVTEPRELAREWHTQAAVYGIIGNEIGIYRDYIEVHRDALEYLLAEREIDLEPGELDDIVAIYHDLEPFEEVKEGLVTLVDAGYRIGIISNGTLEMLQSLVRSIGAESLITATVSADTVKTYKPHKDLYSHAAEQFRADPSAVVHVSNGYFDVLGAMNAGMSGVWLNRQARPPQPFGPEPDETVGSFDDLLALLL
jgi:2-haloacid dehalogenase